MLNQKGGSKTDTLVKLVLIFFISLLSFSVGTFVGKQFSDSQHRMAALESESETREPSSIEKSNLDVKPEDALTEEDVSELAEEFVSGEKAKPTESLERATASSKVEDKQDHSSEKAVEKTAEKKEIVKEAVKDLKKVSKEAERVAKGEEPAPAPKADHQGVTNKMPDVAASSVGKFTVQLSSHNNKDDAEKQAQELLTKGYSAFSVPALVKGKTWYRVSVGLFADFRGAEEYRKKLIEQGAIKSAIVQKIVQ